MKMIGSSFSVFVSTLALLLCPGLNVAAQNQPLHPVSVEAPVRFDVSPPLREMVKHPGPVQASEPKEKEEGEGSSSPIRKTSAAVLDPVEQKIATGSSNFTVGLNLLGVGYGFPNWSDCANCFVPDTNLAVGDTQVTEYVNVVYGIFDKASGSTILGPVFENQLWAGFNGVCSTDLSADVIVQFDKAAHRWVFYHAVVEDEPPYYLCFAVSTSPDATGSFYRYQYTVNDSFPDYGKLGTWTNGYYLTVDRGGAAAGVNTLNRSKMLIGDPSAELVYFQLFDPDFGLRAADIDSSTPPPANEDEFLIGGVRWLDGLHLSLYSVHVDWMNPQGATLTGAGGSQLIQVAAYTPACNGQNGDGHDPCVPQLGTDHLIEVLGDRLMYRLAYFNDQVSAHVGPTALPVPQQHWLVSHTVTASQGQTGVRWYEFVGPEHAIPVTSIAVAQQGTYAPDTNWRSYPSIARDKAGDILVGYMVSGTSSYPSIGMAGRVRTDPAGTLGPEQVVFASTLPETISSAWGDYTSMALDGTDNCTFWYIGQYYTDSNYNNWSTRILSAKFPNCH